MYSGVAEGELMWAWIKGIFVEKRYRHTHSVGPITIVHADAATIRNHWAGGRTSRGFSIWGNPDKPDEIWTQEDDFEAMGHELKHLYDHNWKHK